LKHLQSAVTDLLVKVAMRHRVKQNGIHVSLQMSLPILARDENLASHGALSVLLRLCIPIMHYNNVISIATYWGYSIWHFVMEAFVGLAHISKLDLQSHFIHVNAKNSWTLDWLSLIGITKNMCQSDKCFHYKMPNTITPICGDGNDVIIMHYGNVRYCPRCWAGIIATSIFHRKANILIGYPSVG
jgi:hypothetical protein